MINANLPQSPAFSRRTLLSATGLAAVGVALPTFAGCSDKKNDADPALATGDWKAMTWEGKDEMKKWDLHLANFFKGKPEMKYAVDFGIEWDQYFTKLQTSIAGGSSPDLCWMHDTKVSLFASQGLLEPLDAYLAANRPEGWPDDFYASQVSAFQYGGKQYGFPYDWATAGLYVNLDWLEAADVDVPDENWTYDDLLEAAIKLSKHAASPGKRWGMVLPTDSNFSYAIIKAFGGEFVAGENLDMHYTDPGTVAGYQYLYDAIWKHNAMPNTSQIKAATAGSGDTAAFFSGEKVAMLSTLNDTAFAMPDLIKDKFRWTVAPMPKGVAGRFQGVGGSSFAIPKDCPHPDVTYEFIKYALSDPKNLPVTAKMGSMFVANSKYWDAGVPGKEVVDPKRYEHTFYELGKRDACSPLYFPSYGRWDSSVYAKNMDNLWANKESDVAKVLGQVQSETQPLLQQK